MLRREVFHHGVRVTTALALLFAVMGAPLRPARWFSNSRGPQRMHVNSAAPNSTHGSSRVLSASAPSRPRQVRVTALPSESEEELGWSTRASCHEFHLGPDVSPRAQRDLHTLGIDRAIHPLRC
jgi:hypothetical protein